VSCRKCPRCGGRLAQEETGTLFCLACGERLYDRGLLFAERLADVCNELTARELARDLVHQDPELAERPRWDARKPIESYQPRVRTPTAAKPPKAPKATPVPRMQMAERLGRPPVGPAIIARVPQADYDHLHALAALNGCSLSELVREAIGAYLQGLEVLPAA
jgi:hypothetical protein